MGIIEASHHFTPERGSFRPYARTNANGEVYQYLRNKGFLISCRPAGGGCMRGGKSCSG